jgi:hypothetical protein
MYLKAREIIDLKVATKQMSKEYFGSLWWF